MTGVGTDSEAATTTLPPTRAHRQRLAGAGSPLLILKDGHA